MTMLLKVVGILIILTYLAINIITAKVYNSREMRQTYIEGQCFVGMIAANIFYAPAWFLKALRIAVLNLVA